MKQMVTSHDYRHMPIGTLALFAQRLGRVFASASTWSRKARERGWSRPRKRVYPAKPKVGIRASKPNEYWHLDVTVIRLLDGTKVFLHGVIDNFSRKILAWRICERLSPTTTVAILREAAANLGITPKLVADSGIENVNAEVDALIEDGVITRILALVEVTYSNSIVEAYWRSLKHHWLYLNSLDNVRVLEKLVGFHVEQHNMAVTLRSGVDERSESMELRGYRPPPRLSGGQAPCQRGTARPKAAPGACAGANAREACVRRGRS